MAGMIVAPQPLAVEEGARVLRAGGNAFDAALACAATQFVVDPHSCGVGGYLLATLQVAGERAPRALDAPALAGSRTTPAMWADRVIGPNPGGWGFFLAGKVNEDGYESICTAGVLRGMAEIHRRWGSVPWESLFATASRTAREGWPVHQHLAVRWKERPNHYEGSSLFQKLHASPEAHRIYLQDGVPYDQGEVLRNPDYAGTLDAIAAGGAEEFYSGPLGKLLAEDLERNGSWVTGADLAATPVREMPCVVSEYRGHRIVTSPPPHGGPTLAALLNILEGYDLAGLGHNSAGYIHLAATAMKAAFADRNRHLGDPAFLPELPLSWMTSRERAAEWRRVIDAGEDIRVSRGQPGSPDTTQVTACDDRGNWISLTHSLGSSSGVISPGAGFMWNNSMVNFHPWPGHPNSIAPGKARTTGMAPTLVYRDGRLILALGAPGATRIITSVLQVLLNVLDFDMSVLEAVHAPRFDCQGEAIECQARIPGWTCDELSRKHVVRRLPRSHGGFGLVHAIRLDADSGRLTGAADTGADGMALLVP